MPLFLLFCSMQEVWVAFGINDAKTILKVLNQNGIEGKVQEETTEADAFMMIDPTQRTYRIFVAEEVALRASEVYRVTLKLLRRSCPQTIRTKN